VGVVDEAVEDGVGIGWVADDVVPSADGQLRGDHCRAPSGAFLQDLQKVVACPRVKRLQPPVVKDQEIRPGEADRGPWTTVPLIG